MRTHKYRAYHKTLKKMQQVLAIELDPELGGVEVWGKASVDFSTGEHEAARDFWTWDDIELMEWTGLKDVNGKGIWEGDIVKMPDARQAMWVEYQPPSFVMRHKTKSGGKSSSWSTFDLDYREYQFVEIIGNVWENPGLISEVK